MFDPDHPALLRIREYCLSHPGTSERLSHQTPSFFVKEKHAFLSLWDDHHGDGRLAFCCAAPLGASAAMIRSNPEVFYLPPYVGHLGWLGVRLDRGLPWKEIEGLVAGAYEVVAAKHRARKRAPPANPKAGRSSAKRAPSTAKPRR